MQYCVTMLVEIIVEADNEKAAKSNAESEIAMIDCETQKITSIELIEDD